MATQHNFRIKNGLEVGGVLIVNSSGQLQAVTATSNLSFNDNVRAQFGDGADGTIHHDGSHFRLRAGTGNFNVQANDFHITDASNSSARFVVDHDGETRLYYNGNIKLQTTNTGISVNEGKLTISEVTGSDNYTQIKKTNTGSNLALVSQESIYMMLDGDNNQTNRSFQIKKDAAAPGSGATLFLVEESGNTTAYGNLTVTGNLNITGDINSTSVTDLDVTDKTITVGVGQNEANSGNSGLLVAGPSTQPSLLWNEGANRWAFNYGVNVAGHVIASSNVYAAGPEGFVFGSSTSEGEYIKRSSNDLQFYSGGGHKFTIGTNTTLVSGNLLVPNNSSIQFGDANHNIQGGTNTGGGDMMITSSDDLWLRSRWIRFQDIAGSAGEYARIAWNGSWIYSTLTSQHIKPQSDSAYNLGEVNTRYATVFGDTGRFADLDIDNNVDIDGTLETDGLTVNNNPVYIRQQKGASNAGAGYYRVAENTVGGSGRGAFICTLYTTGGNYAPREVVIQGHTDWSSTETIHTVKSSAANTYFTKARIVRESGDAFLEVYISQAITDLEIEVVAVGHAGWVPKNGTLTAATGTETRVGPEVLIAPGLNTQDVVNATQGFQVNNQTIVDNSRNIENITSITTEGTASSGSIIDIRPSDTNQMFRVRFPDSSTMEMGTTRTGSGNVQKAVVYGQAGVDISTNGVIRASMTQLGDFSLDADCGGLYFGGSTRSTATNAQEYIKKNGLNLDIKGNDNVRLLGDGGNVILHADYSGKVGIGTSTVPNSPLYVKSNSISSQESGFQLIANQTQNAVVKIAEKGNGKARLHMFDGTTEKIAFYTDGTANHISSGNLGIGTNAAEAPLEIYKAVDGDSVGLLVMNQKSYGSGSGTNERSTIALGIAESGTNSLDRKFGTIHVRPYNESDSSQGIFSFGVRGSGAIRDDVLVLRGYSATDQRVGIGTNDPAAGMKLHVNGAVRVDNNEGVATRKIRSGYFSSGQDLTLASGSSANIYMDTQKVGIGISSPTEKLHVNGSIRAGIAGNSSANTPALKVYASGSSDSAKAAIAIQQGTSEGDTILFADYEPHVEWGISCQNSTDQIHFTSGNATNNLGSKTVYNGSGNSRTAYIKFNHDLTDGTTLIAGNTGIGTTSPTHKLHVAGDIRINNGYGLKLYDAAGTGWADLRYDNGSNQVTLQRTFRPSTDLAYNLGTPSFRWGYVYARNLHAEIGLSSDGGIAKQTVWRAVDNSANSGTRYVKICRITASQSSRLQIELAGRSTSYGDGSEPAFGMLIGQLNNDNNYDFTYLDYNLGGPEVVTEIGQVDIDTLSTDIYVKIGAFSEIVARGMISDGTIFPTTGNTGASQGTSSAPSGYTAISERRVLVSDTSENFKFNGNVGIGATAVDKLTIQGSVGFMATNSSNRWIAYTYTDNTFRLNYNGSGADELTINPSSGEASFLSPVTTAGYKLTANTNLYSTDATISLHSSSNGVYVNGAGNNGWLRLNASGTANDRTAINIFGINQGDFITMKTNSAERIRIINTGQVGIRKTPANNNFSLQIEGVQNDGTDARAVHIRGWGSQTGIGSTGPTLVLNNANSTVNNYTKLSFESASNGEVASILAQNINHSSHYGDLVINTRGSSGYSEKLRVTSNGRVGIGAGPITADATLHVDGAVILGGNENKDTNPIAGVHIVDDSYSQWHPTLGPRQVALRVESYWKGSNAHDRAIGDYGGGIVFNILGGHSTTHSHNMHGWIGPRVWDTPGRERAALVFATNNDTGTLPSNSSTTITERMCITPAGLVGIKNTNPAATLEVGTLTSGSTGNVIINSEGGNPPALQVKSRTNRARINIQDNDTSGYIIAEDSRISIGFADALSGNNINIKNDHNVGIGTISPQGKLDVDGDLRITRNIESNNTYHFLSMGSDRGANDYGGLYKDYWRMNIMTPGPNTTGESSHHAYGTLVFSGVTGSNTTYADRMCITRNGEVGIGTTTPTYLLDVAGDVGVNEYIYHNDDTNTYFRFQSDRIDIRAGGSDTITVKPTQLDINQSAKYSGFSTSGGNNRDQAIYIGRDQTDTSTEYFTMGWKSTARSGEQMQPTNGPYNGGAAFYIEAGGTTEAAGMCLDQDSVNIYGSSDSGATIRVIDKDSDVVTFEMLQTSWDGRFKGNVIAYGSMSSISDRRIKENIEPINPVIDKIKNIGVYKYNKITAPEIYKDRKEIGVIAQEVQKEFPDLVNEETVDPKETAGLDTILSVDYEHLTAVLLKGMQEQQNQIDSMKKQIEELTSKLTGE